LPILVNYVSTYTMRPLLGFFYCIEDNRWFENFHNFPFLLKRTIRTF